MKRNIEARLDEQATLIFEFDSKDGLLIYLESIEFEKKIPIDAKYLDSEFLTDILEIYQGAVRKFN